MKPGNRPKFGKVPIPAAETPEDEAGWTSLRRSPDRRAFFYPKISKGVLETCDISLLPNP